MKQYLLFITFLVSSCYVGEDLPPDQSIWEYDLPFNQGLLQNPLLELDDRLQIGEFQSIEGLLIVKNDHLVYENYYANGASRNFRKNIGSGGLSITLAAIGIAEDKGLLSLDDPIAMYLPEYEAIWTDSPEKENITIEHLLVHRSGLSWNENIKGFLDPANNLNEMKNSNEWVVFVLNRPLEASPGFRYSYNTGAGVILAKVIENASGMNFESFLQENLLDPLTVTEISLQQDPSGNFNGGDGYTISLIDWTKIGYLFLQGGIWEGRTIISPNFIQESITEQFQISNSQSTGYLWTLFGDNFQNSFGIDHEEIYSLSGALGQSLYIIPSENMVVTILADNFFGFNNLSLNLFAEITFLIQ